MKNTHLPKLARRTIFPSSGNIIDEETRGNVKIRSKIKSFSQYGTRNQPDQMKRKQLKTVAAHRYVNNQPNHPKKMNPKNSQKAKETQYLTASETRTARSLEKNHRKPQDFTQLSTPRQPLALKRATRESTGTSKSQTSNSSASPTVHTKCSIKQNSILGTKTVAGNHRTSSDPIGDRPVCAGKGETDREPKTEERVSEAVAYRRSPNLSRNNLSYQTETTRDNRSNHRQRGEVREKQKK